MIPVIESYMEATPGKQQLQKLHLVTSYAIQESDTFREAFKNYI